MKQIAIALDQLFNTLLGGYADETLSARAYRMSKYSNRWYHLMCFIDLLFWWQHQHCYESYLSERIRRHLPLEYRNA